MYDFYKYVLPNRMHPKLTEAVVAMMSTGNLPYYGEFALFINFYETKKNPYVPTAGINVTSAGMNFFWDRGFMETLTQPQTNFLLIHEECHLLFDHVRRTVGYDQKTANIVQDMIINQIIHDDIMKKQGLGVGSDPFISIPKDMFGKNSALFIPKQYKGEPIFEDLYEWYVTKRKEWQEKNKDKIKQMQKESSRCPHCGGSLGQSGDPQEDESGQNPGQNQQGQGQQGQGQQGQGQQGQGGNQEQKRNQGQNQQGSGEDQEDNEGGNGQKDQKNQKNKSENKGNENGQGDENQDDGDDPNDNGKPKCPHCGKDLDNNKSKQGNKDTSGNDRYGKYGREDTEMYSLDTIFEGQEREEQVTLDNHLSDDIPAELKKEIVESIMTKFKNRGLESGEIEAIIHKLRKTRKDYLREIKRTMSNHCFGNKKERTIVRPNRRGISGLKGSKKYKNELNVILDTSGSMSGEFEKVLNYIFQNDIIINLIQIDAAIQKVVKIKNKKELEKMTIKGLGGTTLTPAIEYIADKKNKIYMYNMCILTDGCTDTLDFKGITTKTLILSTAGKSPITNDNGRVKQIENIGKQD